MDTDNDAADFDADNNAADFDANNDTDKDADNNTDNNADNNAAMQTMTNLMPTHLQGILALGEATQQPAGQEAREAMA